MIFDKPTVAQLARNLSQLPKCRQNSHRSAYEAGSRQLIAEFQPNPRLRYFAKDHAQIAGSYSETYYLIINFHNTLNDPRFRVKMKFLGADHWLVDEWIRFDTPHAFGNCVGDMLHKLKTINANN